MSDPEIKVEWLKCSLNPVYFAETYVQIFNATLKTWIPFALWPEQRRVLLEIAANQYIVMLKARQLGMSWLCLTYGLWMMIFHPAPNIMIMSKRDEEAVELLSNRLVEMHARLPKWMQAKRIEQENAHDFMLSNGSRAKAFPTSGGRSYTGSLVLLDEADFLPDLNKVLNAIKPTVDAGGQLIMISTVDKEKPLSPFKQLFREAYQENTSSYHAIFLPWSARPDRTREWYAQMAIDMRKQNSDSDDSLYQEYPEDPEQALAPLQLDKRIPYAWIQKCRRNDPPINPPGAPAVPNLTIYVAPVECRQYVIGADPAEGNPTSDDSSATVIDATTWEEMAVFAGKWEPEVFAGYIDLVGAYYNAAPVMCERNNHGHALILALQHNGVSLNLKGHDSDRPGWLNNAKGKTLMYDFCAQSILDESVIIRDPVTVDQLASIEADTLSAPPGMHDDHADSYALALVGCKYKYVSGVPSTMINAPDIIEQYDKSSDW